LWQPRQTWVLEQRLIENASAPDQAGDFAKALTDKPKLLRKQGQLTRGV
jgi:hypothetical protein